SHRRTHQGRSHHASPAPARSGPRRRHRLPGRDRRDRGPFRDLRRPCRSRKVDMTSTPVIDNDVPPDNPLTTKEGWGAFVRHTPARPPREGGAPSARHPPAPLALLSSENLAALPPRRGADHDQPLRDSHAALPLVNPPTIQKVISTGRLLVQLNRRQISARR